MKIDDLNVSGRLHSIESFGAVDGPGIRLVVFCQGCPLRCAYCHNPDTWDMAAGEVMKVSEILDAYQRNAGFYAHGGITLSGGEPLVQPEFAASLFRAAHAYRDGPIHTCLDTSGGIDLSATKDKVVEVLKHTDLVLLDIKHAFPKQYKWLTGKDQEKVLSFGDLLAQLNIPTLIRHVVVPDITDSKEELEGIGEIISCWPNVVGLELLAYHTMGAQKYTEQKIPYRLVGVPPMDEQRLPELKHYALQKSAQCIRSRRYT